MTGSEDVNVIGFCAGGIVSTAVLNYLAASGDTRIHSMSYAVTLLDFAHQAPIQAFAHSRLISLARHRNRQPGVISARDMGIAFTLMRPNDLIWNYWVNNYLLGNKPFGLRHPVVERGRDESPRPAAQPIPRHLPSTTRCVSREGLTVLGTPVDLAAIEVPTFVVGAMTDHLTPWEGCYRTTQLLSGPTTFVLSNSGHIQSLVNPPGNPKASYYTGPDPGSDPSAWLADATHRSGSWWEEWSTWMADRSGDQCDAPRSLGSALNPPVDEAPGRYVRESAHEEGAPR